MAILFKNNAYSTLATGITSGALSLTLSAGTGARFPQPVPNSPFLMTLVSVNAGVEVAWEIVKCTARVNDVCTIERNQEGTTPLSWVAGVKIEHRVTASQIYNAVNGIFANNPGVSNVVTIGTGGVGSDWATLELNGESTAGGDITFKSNGTNSWSSYATANDYFVYDYTFNENVLKITRGANGISYTTTIRGDLIVTSPGVGAEFSVVYVNSQSTGQSRISFTNNLEGEWLLYSQGGAATNLTAVISFYDAVHGGYPIMISRGATNADYGIQFTGNPIFNPSTSFYVKHPGSITQNAIILGTAELQFSYKSTTAAALAMQIGSANVRINYQNNPTYAAFQVTNNGVYIYPNGYSGVGPGMYFTDFITEIRWPRTTTTGMYFHKDGYGYLVGTDSRGKMYWNNTAVIMFSNGGIECLRVDNVLRLYNLPDTLDVSSGFMGTSAVWRDANGFLKITAGT